MKRSMFAIGVLVLSGVTTGCRMKADVPPPAQTVTDACAAALAAARQDTEMDRAIGRAQARARAGTGGKEALERLGYLYVSRARAAHDAGDYKLAESGRVPDRPGIRDRPAALLLRGHVLHQLHRFHEAEQIAQGARVDARGRARLRAARRRADGAGPARRGCRRLPADDRSQAVLPVVHARRAPALDDRGIWTARSS